MTRLISISLVALSLAGCSTLRDMAVYRTEIDFSDLMVSRQAPTVRRFLESSCVCSEGAWLSGPNIPTGDCENAADWYFTYSARWSWHVEMMRYNGGVIETDPGAAPAINVSCALPELPAPATAGGES
jgi:hypothetical protein